MKVSVIDAIRCYIASGDMELPVFNHTAMRVQKELVKRQPDIRKLENIIVSDQSLSSKILKMANSSFYRGLSEVRNIRSAIVRLGTKEVGRITLLAASKDAFRTHDKLLNILMKKLWQHSVGCAMGSLWLAKRCKLDNIGGDAFFAGLLHDSGKLFILLVLDKLKKRDKTINTSMALLLEAMAGLHTEEGYNLMRKWNMPEIYCDIARDHHRDDFDGENLILLLVRISNMTCKKLGIGIERDPDLIPATTEEATLLNLTELDLAELEIMLEDTKAISGR